MRVILLFMLSYLILFSVLKDKAMTIRFQWIQKRKKSPGRCITEFYLLTWLCNKWVNHTRTVRSRTMRKYSKPTIVRMAMHFHFIITADLISTSGTSLLILYIYCRITKKETDYYVCRDELVLKFPFTQTIAALMHSKEEENRPSSAYQSLAQCSKNYKKNASL